MTTEIAEYSTTEAALADLRSRHLGVLHDTTTSKGMEAAKTARAEIRSYRTSLEKLRVDIKAPALERCRLIDSEAKRITAELLKMEEPIDQLIKKEEDRKEAEKQAKLRIEQERIEREQELLNKIHTWPMKLIGKSSDDMLLLIDQLKTLDIEWLPDETKSKALELMQKAIHECNTMLVTKLDQEEERRKLDAEKIELDKQRAIQFEADQKAKLERNRIEEDARLLRDAEDKLRRANEDRLHRDRMESERHQAEEARLEAERKENEAKQLKEREYKDRLDRIKSAGTSLLNAAIDALNMLEAAGFKDHDVTLSLRFAIDKESKGTTNKKRSAK